MDKQEIKWQMQRGKNVIHLLKAVYWAARCGYPAGGMKVVGVTGTDGKTTTCTLIYEMLKKAGYAVGLVSTVGVKYKGTNGKEVEVKKGLHNTNPGPEVLQPLLFQMKNAGVTYVVLEVTAHGIDQYRVWGCNISVGVLTNITHEHLDDFVDMERYGKTKFKLFGGVKNAVLNGDDLQYEEYKKKILEYKPESVPEKEWMVRYGKTKISKISPALWGDYNLYNIGAAEKVAGMWGVSEKQIAEVVGNFPGVKGRREEVVCGQKYRVVVDFAHTPNALKSLLVQLSGERKSKQNRLIVVFGCTGGRDKAKRPEMGKIASGVGDVVAVTADDTRYEDQNEIAGQIMRGIENCEEKMKKGKLCQINDRKEAIRVAIDMAKPGDIVVLAGKGHETSILHKGVEYPWSDVEVARSFIKND